MTSRLGALVVLLLTLGLLTAPSASAATKSLDVFVPRGYAEQTVVLAVRLRKPDDSPDAEEEVRVERYDGSAWREVATLTTDAEGRATQPVELARRNERNRFRVLHDTGTRTITARRDVAVKPRSSVLTLAGRKQVQDGRPVTFRVRWQTGNEQAIRGTVTLQRKSGKRWRTVKALRTDETGRATYTSRPTGVTRWRVVGARDSWYLGDTSPVLRVRSLPPGEPVSLPRGAPRPRVDLPAQARATGKGANAVASTIPNRVWRSMVGKSWRSGCPVGRGGLRLVRTNYWDFDGYRKRGELVVSSAIAGKTVGVMKALYDARIPIRHMYRVDRFGYSGRVNGADDYASMAADNTSAFNCRDVVGSPGRRSPHSYGRSIDINPWENPYRSAQGWTPNTWWVGKSHPRVAWRSSSHQVVRIFANHGFRWTYGTFDAHHFDGRRAAEARRTACGGGVCH